MSDARVSGRKKRARHWVWAMSLLQAVALVVLWQIEQHLAERHWLATGLTYMPQHILAFAMPFLLVFAVVCRDARSLLLQGATFVFFLWTFLGFRYNVPSRPPGDSVRVMTYNIHHGTEGLDHVVRVVRAARPDVLCLQEANAGAGAPDTLQGLKDRLPEYQFARHEELAIASRWEFSDWQHAPTIGRRRPALIADVRANGVLFRVINVHFATGGAVASLTRPNKDRPAYLRDTARVRVRQAEGVAKLVEDARMPVILCGDFNTPPRGTVYARLAGLLEDGFARSGRGFGYTFHSGLPVLRIDYVWTRNGARAWNTYVPGSRASDHRPVLSEISFTDSNTK